MLMCLGFLVFDLTTLPFDSRKRSLNARWGSSNRIGKRPVHQYLGPGDETLSLDATLYPELTGPGGLTTLRAMTEQGKAWLLVDGDGNVWPDAWIIDKVDESQTHFTPDGVALKTTVTLSLKRYDGPGTGLGHLPDSDPTATPSVLRWPDTTASEDEDPFAALWATVKTIRNQTPPKVRP